MFLRKRVTMAVGVVVVMFVLNAWMFAPRRQPAPPYKPPKDFKCGGHSLAKDVPVTPPIPPKTNLLELIGEGDKDFSMGSCEPVQRFHFVKTHKTAGSTIATMLFRYGDSRDLNFALPIGNVQFSYKRPDTCTPTEWRKGELSFPPYDVSASHGPYRREWSMKHLPGRKLLTVVRDPVTRFVSAWKFFNGNTKVGFPEDAPVEEVIPLFLANKTMQGLMSPYSFYLNNMAADLGWKNNCPSDFSHEDGILYSLEHEYDLVLLSERIDESLALLQHEMCWSLSDVVYVSRKVLGNGEGAKDWLTEEQKEKIRELCQQDMVIYNKAVEVFERRVASLPSCGGELCGNVPMCLSEHAALISEMSQKVGAACEDYEKRKRQLGRELYRTCSRLDLDTNKYAYQLQEERRETFPKMGSVLSDLAGFVEADTFTEKPLRPLTHEQYLELKRSGKPLKGVHYDV